MKEERWDEETKEEERYKGKRVGIGSIAWEGKKVETRKEQKKKRKKVEGRD